MKSARKIADIMYAALLQFSEEEQQYQTPGLACSRQLGSVHIV